MDEFEIPFIMGIPREVRGIIFNKLDQKCSLRLRLVCSQWRSEVDEFVEFCVQLDERLSTFQRVLELRVNKCNVIHLLQPPPKGTGTTILKYPNLLRNLKISTDKICADNFNYLLCDCSRFLHQFSLLITLQLLTFPFPPDLTYNFESLRKLSLSLCTIPQGGMVMGIPTKIQDNLFIRLLAHLMPHLSSLTIELRLIGFPQISTFSALILSFLAKHWRSIKKLDFDLIQGHGIPSAEVRHLADEDVKLIDFNLFKKLDSLSEFRIVNSTAVGIDLWAQMLSNQKKLKFLETDILPAPDSLFKQIVLNNVETLVEVDIGDLTIGNENSENEEDRRRPFDLSVFSECHSLRKLTLDRNSTRRRATPETAELINLFNLPPFIEELAINYFLILSDELLILFNSNLGNNLLSLSLSQCGNSGQFGVDGTVLQTIIALRNIGFLEISPLNFNCNEEREKLNLILTNFGFAEDHSYIQLNRVGENSQVDFSDFEPI